MKRKIVYSFAAIAITAVAVINVNLSLNSQTNDLSAVLLENIEALAEESDSTGATITSGTECHQRGGYWNMALTILTGGVIQQSCEVAGEISLLGVTVKGNYKKGSKYWIRWATYSCTNSPGNCCIAANQTTKIFDN